MNANLEKVRRAPITSAKLGRNGLEICLRLYIASSTPNSERAEANLDAALREFTEPPDFRVEIIDVLADAKRGNRQRDRNTDPRCARA